MTALRNAMVYLGLAEDDKRYDDYDDQYVDDYESCLLYTSDAADE